MKRFASLLFAILILCTVTAVAQNSGPAKELADSCTQKFKANDLDGAFADCSKAIEIDSRASSAYAIRGLIYIQKDNLDNAIADLTKALELDPRNPALLRVRGMAKLKNKDFDGALADHNRVVEIDPSLDSYSQRALIHFAKGDYDKAIEDFNVAIEKSSNPVKLYNLRGQAKLRKKDFDGALADYNKAIELDPKFPDAYVYRGVTLLNMHRDSDAQKDFDKFLEMKPGEKESLEKVIEKAKREREPAK